MVVSACPKIWQFAFSRIAQSEPQWQFVNNRRKYGQGITAWRTRDRVEKAIARVRKSRVTRRSLSLLAAAYGHLDLPFLHSYGMLLRLDIRTVRIGINLGELGAEEYYLSSIVNP